MVIVNSGGPVAVAWHERVPALLLAWFPGQEAGDGLADILFGRTEPGGRLPPRGPPPSATSRYWAPNLPWGCCTTRRACTSGTAAGCDPPPRPPTGSDTGSVTHAGSTRS
ncbi:glycoside hydrolase family 3 C-terminal domain-containing protein [Streptomyces sp. M10(2022)]